MASQRTESDRCVCCGEEVPEGRMVCFSYENKQLIKDAQLKVALQAYQQDKKDKA